MSDAGHKRPQQVANLVRHEVGRLLAKGLKDPRVGFVTVTHVHLPGDLRQATLYVSILGDAAQKQVSMAGLRAAAGYLRTQLGHSLSLRYCPELRFVADDTLQQARRVEQLLAAVASGATESPPAPSTEPLPAPQTGREMPLPEQFAPPPPPAARPRSAAKRRRRSRLRAVKA